jgi:hypothetical protein
MRKSKRIDVLEKQVTHLAEQATELQAHLRADSFRTRRALFVGGQSDGQRQWIDEADPTILRPRIRMSDWDPYRSTDEAYSLVGESPVSNHTVYLYEYAGLRQRKAPS